MSETVTFEGVTFERLESIGYAQKGAEGGVWIDWDERYKWRPRWEGFCGYESIENAETTARELLAACAFARHLNEKEGKA